MPRRRRSTGRTGGAHHVRRTAGRVVDPSALAGSRALHVFSASHYVDSLLGRLPRTEDGPASRRRKCLAAALLEQPQIGRSTPGGLWTILSRPKTNNMGNFSLDL